MAILERTNRRRVGRHVIGPAVVLVAALVPALAAVAPTNPPGLPTPTALADAPSPPEPTASVEAPAPADVSTIVAELHALEDRLQAHAESLEALHAEMVPELDAIDAVKIDVDDQAMAEIEAAMKPYLDRIAAIELDMAPVEAAAAEVERRIRELELHVEDGTLADVERQIDKQLRPMHDELEQLHTSLAPQLELIEAVHREMEPLHRQIEAFHEQLEPQLAELDEIQAALEPFHDRMEEIQREMEPLQQQMERLGRELETAVGSEIAGVLKRQLVPVTGPQAPIDEAAVRLLEDAHIQVHEGAAAVHVSTAEARQILTDLLSPHRIGSQQAFDEAVASAVDAIADLEIPAR